MSLRTLDRHCTIGQITVRLRNAGASLGLDYPFIHGQLGERTHAIWNRHTGVVRSVIYDEYDWRAEAVSRKTNEALNGATEHDLTINVLHDQVA
ncbi:hypothetical protein LCGC14_2953300 [marine sediment metagenome]|uniref:Uncharacterized protein n=1 Tax=marine sediment metagenome TaxID=412755 RepID=A0A0F9A5S6_9ZZZZ